MLRTVTRPRLLPRNHLPPCKPRIAQFSILPFVHDTLVGIHDSSGLPWYATIPLSTALLSAMMLPIAIQSRRKHQVIAALQPILDAQSAVIAQHARTSFADRMSSNVLATMKQHKRALHKKHGVNLLALLAPSLLKLPVWITFSLAIRSMSGSPIPYWTPLPLESSFRSGGVAWMQDLTVADGTLLLPVMFGLLNLINVEVNASQGVDTARTVAAAGGGGGGERGGSAGRLRLMLERGMRVVSIGLIYIAAQMPAALCLYWVSSACLTLSQNIWLNHRYPAPRRPQTTTTTTTPSLSGDGKLRLELPGVDDDDDLADRKKKG